MLGSLLNKQLSLSLIQVERETLVPRSLGGDTYVYQRRWFVLERSRRDTNGGRENEVTVTSEQQANKSGLEGVMMMMFITIFAGDK